ncbi:AraC family transcriptional regulator [Myxococcus stipitatus DSM 14675]|uniref:AraC family transcriptional regulator n=1 Tax=Myxococcus stipitatus (strain DSM 14675 / JCM 12634 / Mx s8) TaxID=1278073 RepID=L7U3Y6_MYXSD|nr:AraC family transcriptional regulator [Myxococcus stipitatus]AGC42888.1 AraC family transcriptional regulator [Myxococcus stipitatus DSM 14675]
MAQLLTLLESEQFRVLDSRCQHPRAGPAEERGGDPGHLVLLRRGCFSYHRGLRRFVADPCHPRVDYRVGHPGAEGDDATVIKLAPELFDELWGRRGPDHPELGLSAAVHLRHARVCAALRDPVGDQLSREESVFALLEVAASDRQCAGAPVRGDRGARRRTVGRVRALLAAQLSANLSLDTVAREARCSPFHLMRLFHAETGLSLRAYRRQLRVFTALGRLGEGERDLARLALELGFSHHSHLSQSVRQVLGLSPARLRAELRRGARRFLTAGRRSRL